MFVREKMSELLKIPSNHRDVIKKDTQERKRNLLHLIVDYLRMCNLHETADCLAEEAQLQDTVEVCDNVDLDVILQEYQSYYMVKFQKMPKLVRKIEVSERTRPKTNKKNKRTPPVVKEKSKREVKEEEPDDFQFEIISLTEKAVGAEATSKPLCEFENYSSEWREVAEQIKKDMIPKNLGIGWRDCVGLQEAITTIKESVIFPTIYPRVFSGTLTPFKGILLYGPPGTGKTLLAKALACEHLAPVINVTCSAYISKWRGESEKLIKTLFDVAKLHTNCVIFIDEVDALVSTTDHQHEASVRFKSELLVQMDGILNGDERVFVLGVTNSPWRLDSALLRRFERRVLVDLPNAAARRDIFCYYFEKSGVAFAPADLQRMAEATENFSGADVKLLCKEAMMSAVREVLREDGGIRVEKLRAPTVNDVIRARSNIKSSLSCGLIEKYREWNEKHGCL